MSRGSIFALSAGARRGLVLLWTALLMCSLVLQYGLIAPATALAINPDVFELDGNVEADPVPGDDWNPLYTGGGSAYQQLFITDPYNGNGDKYFDQGGSKDISDIPNWLWTDGSQPQDKNDIEHAYAAAYKDNGNLLVYVGLDRYASNGAGQVGFWFLQDDAFGLNANNTFSGKHKVGDVLVQIDFENGGANPVARVYEWNGSGITLKQVNGSCADAIGQDICAIASTAVTDPAWSFDDKFTPGADNDIPAGGMVESGVNLTKLGLDDGCFASFLAETRSSPSEDSTLSDFVFGNFALCNKPDMKTDVKQLVDGQVINLEANGAINVGETVFDRATLSGDSGPVTGHVQFYVCRNGSTWPDCSSGGTALGGQVGISPDGVTESPNYTATQTGFYCFRAEYIPAAGSKYFAASHTNQTTECFKVIPAEIKIVKTRDAATVSAGDQIGFTITVSNIGEGKAYGVAVDDPLPAGFAWSIESKSPADSNWTINGTNTLIFTAASMASGAESSVHIVAATDAADCGVVNNTAYVTTQNDGSDSDGASLEILCPDVKVTKTPDGGPVSRGDTATFSIKVENIGDGTAKNVVVSDTLPSGLTWTEDEADCSIAGGVLTCNAGDLAKGESKTYTVSADTDLAECSVIDNTATATATNEPSDKLANNSDDGDIAVLCAEIDIEKTADDDAVNAGEQIGFTITVTNNGAGVAYDVEATDDLPAGFSWTIDPASAGWSIANGTLTYTAASLQPGASSSVHIVANTTAEQCKVVENTANVTAGNDGSDSSYALTEILCPDVTVEKTPDGGSVSAGETATFSIKVTNTGDGLAKGVTVSDTLPAGLDWTTSDADCSITDGVLTCDAGDLAKGESMTFTVSADTDLAACTVIDNTATVAAANEAEADTGNNSDDGDITVNCPDITVEKTPDAGSVTAGDDASFSMTVTNLGPGLARDVTLTDALPGGLDWTLVDGYDGTCEIVAGELSCDFGDLAEKATASVTVMAATTPEVCGDLDNTATVAAANEAAGATAPNSDSGKITVNCPDLEVTKTAADDLIDAGDTASFTVTVKNIGAGTAYGVTLDDPLPAGVTWLITSNDEACDIVDGDLECAFGDLAPGASASVSVAGVTDAEDCKVLTNIATGFADNEPADAYTNNVGQDEITVQCPDVTVEKTVVASPVNAGDELAFDIKVWNIGPGLARDVFLTDPLPAGINWTVDDTEHCSIVDQTLTCVFGDMAAADSFTVRVSGQTDAEDCKVIDNTATVGAKNEADADKANNASTDSGEVLCPDVSITKTAASPVVNAGDEVAFEVTVKNNGKGVAYDVQVEDILPTNPGTLWTIKLAGSDPGFSIDGTKVTFGPADLAAGESRTVVIRTLTTPETCGVVDNTATMTYTGGEGSDDDSVTVQCPDLIVDKTAGNGEINAGDEASFTMTVTNVGDGVAYKPTLTDTLPAGIAWSEDSMYCSIADGVLSCAFPDMEKGDEYKVTVSGTTSAEVCGVIPNTATVAADNEANTSNNEDSDEILVNCPDVTISKTAMNTPVLLGQDVEFEITATNIGPGSAYGVVITDALPAGLAWTEDSEDCEIADGTLTCQAGTLGEGQTFTVHVSAPTMEALEVCSEPEMIDNTAVVSADNEDPDKLGNNEDSDAVEVQCADISLVKTAGDAADGAILSLAKPGSVVYTYVVTNTGSATLTDFELVDDHATPANEADDVTVSCPKTELAPDESMTCTVTLSVTFGVWTNTAVVTGHPVLDPGTTVKDTDTAVVRVPEPVRTPKVTPPPTSTIDGTDSTTGTTGLLLVLAALAGLMLAAGYMRPARATARRRSRKG